MIAPQLLALLVLLLTAGGATAQPVGVLLDTDLGPDADDAGALAVLHALADRGEAEILGVACGTTSPWCAPAADAINTSIERFIPARFRSRHHEHVRRFGEAGVTMRRMGGEFMTHPVGQASRMITRQLPVAGLHAVNSMIFWRRLVRLSVTSAPSGVQPTR